MPSLISVNTSYWVTPNDAPPVNLIAPLLPIVPVCKVNELSNFRYTTVPAGLIVMADIVVVPVMSKKFPAPNVTVVADATFAPLPLVIVPVTDRLPEESSAIALAGADPDTWKASVLPAVPAPLTRNVPSEEMRARSVALTPSNMPSTPFTTAELPAEVRATLLAAEKYAAVALSAEL